MTDDTWEIYTRIATWPLEDAAELLDYMADEWDTFYGSVETALRPEEAALLTGRDGRVFYRFATGGWSHNEAIIGACRESLAGRIQWRLSAVGGLHIYEAVGWQP